MIYNNTPIAKVLFNLSLSMEDVNKVAFLNWAEQGARKILDRNTLSPQWFKLTVINHHSDIPKELSAINQMVKYLSKDCYELIRKSFNLVRPCMPNCECENLYSIKNNRLVFSFKEGTVLLLGYTWLVDENNNLLIPDDPELIEAIEHYVKYKYYDSKLNKDNIIFNERTFHLRRFGLLSTKLKGKYNLPSQDQLENIKNQSMQLLSSNAYNNLFASISLNEQIDYVK